MSGFTVLPLPCAAEVVAGDDLAAHVERALVDAGAVLQDGDVLCVASKVVAKAEGAEVPLGPGDADAARRALARRVARRVVADTPWVLVVETQHGFVCANAGIDASNVAPAGDGPDGRPRRALLLPDAPDDAAAGLRAALRARTGAHVGVVVTDTFGRPWRLGQVDVALGAAGVVALRDDRGTPDRDGRPLAVTMVAVADQLAAAADLARTKADGTPFVLLRGLDVAGAGSGADLLRPAAQDVFRHGGATAVEVALQAAGTVLQAAGTVPEGAGTVPEGARAADPGAGAGSAVGDATLERLASAARGAVLPVRVVVHDAALDLLAEDEAALGAALQAVAVLAGALDLRMVATPLRAGRRVAVLPG